MPYNPPSNDQVDFQESGTYSPPSNDSVDFTEPTSTIEANLQSSDADVGSLIGQRERVAKIQSLDADRATIVGQREREAKLQSYDLEEGSIKGTVVAFVVYENPAEIKYLVENNGETQLVDNIAEISIPTNDGEIIVDDT